METLEVKVENREEAERLKRDLKKRRGVVSVTISATGTGTRKASSSRINKGKIDIDKITLASEASLAEAWDSPEDARWDE